MAWMMAAPNNRYNHHRDHNTTTTMVFCTPRVCCRKPDQNSIVKLWLTPPKTSRVYLGIFWILLILMSNRRSFFHPLIVRECASYIAMQKFIGMSLKEKKTPTVKSESERSFGSVWPRVTFVFIKSLLFTKVVTLMTSSCGPSLSYRIIALE